MMEAWYIDLNLHSNPSRTPSEVREVIRNTLGLRTNVKGSRITISDKNELLLARLNLDGNIVAITKV